MQDLMQAFQEAEGDLSDKLERVRAARRALEGREKPGRKPVSAPETPKASKRGRRNRSTRSEQALALVTAKPDITAGEIAKSMKIKANYLYRVMTELEKANKVKKSGRTYTAV